MEAERQTKIASSLPIIGVLFIIAGAYHVSRSQLKSSRPEAPAGLKHPVTEKDKIEARLWQDPFKAVSDQRQAKRSQERKDPCEPAVYQLSSQIDRFIKKENISAPNAIRRFVGNKKVQLRAYVLNQQQLHIMLIMVRDGNSAEDYERRLRNRYATLMALRASGMAAKDTKHIQYFTTAPHQENNLIRGVSKIEGTSHDSSELTVFPYEWFEHEELYPDTIELADDRPERVLLIWLPECVFSKQPLTRLAQLIDALGRRRNSTFYNWASNMGKYGIKIDLIGPSNSGTLRAMLDEIPSIQNSPYPPEDTDTVDVKSKLRNLGIFSPWSTASPALLADDSFNENPNAQNSVLDMYDVIPKKFKKIHIEFCRMVGSDDLLAMHLLQELKKRGVCPVSNEKHHVALISEWDTFYGKAFPLTFAAMMENIDPNNSRLVPNWIKYAKNLSQKRPGDYIHYFPKNLHTYTYICGIDGILTGSQSSEDKQSNEDAQNENTESLSKWASIESLKRPIDRSQLDYVRRLAKKLSDEYDRPDKKLKAIGVVGTDVYDKLILLHALREQFSDVIFFTTDLDARLMHDEQYKWTRNVIVASNFGLELSDTYQRNTYQYWDESSFSSFRDTHQTALFFSCRAALGLRVAPYEIEQVNFKQDVARLLYGRVYQRLQGNKMLRDDIEKIQQLIIHPRLFEIGRDRAVNISADDAEIHPPNSRWPGRKTFTRYLILILLILATCFTLVVQLNPGLLEAIIPGRLRKDSKNPEKEPDDKLKEKRTENTPIVPVWITWLLAAPVIGFVIVAMVDHYRPGGEPFSLVGGVSIWPGEALRLIVTILSICFIFKSLSDLEKNEEELSDWFKLREPNKFRKLVISHRNWVAKKKRSGGFELRKPNQSKKLAVSHRTRLTKKSLSEGWNELSLLTWWRYRREWIGLQSLDTGKHKGEKVNARELWREYLVRGIRRNRFQRSIPMSFMYVVLFIALAGILGIPNTPYRGRISLFMDYLLLCLSLGATFILIFFVVDATKLSLRFIRKLKEPITFWPEKLLNSFKKENNKQPGAHTVRDPKSPNNSLDHVYTQALAEWLDIKFIASHTEAVGKLIYYPFIILLIMFAARNRYFDNWDFPISLIIIYLLNSICALCCGWMLRREAEKTRNIALDRIEKELVEATAVCDECRSNHLETMIGQIKSIRQGAYSPFTENPVLHAILIPSGGLSLLTLLRFL